MKIPFFLHAEYQEHPSSDGPPTGEWVLMDTAQDSQLGTAQRVQEKEIPGILWMLYIGRLRTDFW